MAAVARAAADGHTWLLANENLATAEALQATPLRATEALAPLHPGRFCPFTLTRASAARASRDMPDLVAAARARPATLGYATNGSGTGGHVAGARCKRAGDITLDHVPIAVAARRSPTRWRGWCRCCWSTWR
jgi:tripartite-type tricarboxylate transporter receptor subunit TctC